MTATGPGELLLSPNEMGRADALAAALIPSSVLMENAGRSVARLVQRLYRPCRTLVACGPGNNGGDGFVVARRLQSAGWPVAVAVLSPSRAGSDAAGAAGRWHGPAVPFVPGSAARAELVIDALFGAGLGREIPAKAADLLEAGPRVAAIDLPSGVDGWTGAARGRVRAADATITFVRRKPGHLLFPGRALCGRVWLADIGMPAAALAGAVDDRTVRRNTPDLWSLRTPDDTDHKYSRGTVVVCAGAHMGGAARLAARAARRVGAGLVRLSRPDAGPMDGVDDGLIVDREPLARQLDDARRRVWVCGPGLDIDEAARLIPVLLGPGAIGRGLQVVVDGGGLGYAAGQPERLVGSAVLTPHEGEFARVFGAPGDDRVASVRAAAARTGAVVVLKGASTIIAAPDGRAAINDHATAALATAGSGDTLAGVAGGLLAEGLDPYEAASAAVWLHGEAGRLAGPGLIAEDLAGLLPAAMGSARGFVGGDPFDRVSAPGFRRRAGGRVEGASRLG